MSSEVTFVYFYSLFMPPTALLTVINCMSTKWTMKIQDIFTIAKLLALVSIIVAGVYYMGSGKYTFCAWDCAGEHPIHLLIYDLKVTWKTSTIYGRVITMRPVWALHSIRACLRSVDGIIWISWPANSSTRTAICHEPFGLPCHW